MLKMSSNEDFMTTIHHEVSVYGIGLPRVYQKCMAKAGFVTGDFCFVHTRRGNLNDNVFDSFT